jgi:peptidoglycan/LPS O-acetylase OafA/YrhL
MSNNKKIYELESVRGLAALLIVIYHIHHISLWNSFFNFEIIKNGYLMVELFFVLSGFVIYNSYFEKIINY